MAKIGVNYWQKRKILCRIARMRVLRTSEGENCGRRINCESKDGKDIRGMWIWLWIQRTNRN